MKNLTLMILVLLPLKLWAVSLKVGDVLLQPLDCYTCTLIEAQERSIYSHMGLVMQVRPQVIVVESLGQVRRIPLQEFAKRNEKGQRISVRRLQNPRAVEHIERNIVKFQRFYLDNFEGLPYDDQFVWNNFDKNGKEKLYCSEMITKLFAQFMGIEVKVKKMRYDKNRDAWIKYFGGNPPDGKWGNSPADFEKSHLFYEVGEL